MFFTCKHDWVSTILLEGCNFYKREAPLKKLSFKSSIKLKLQKWWQVFYYKLLKIFLPWRNRCANIFHDTFICWKRNELVSLINKLHKLHLSEENIENWSCHDRCCFLNNLPGLVARHFHYRAKVFLKEIVVYGTLGKIKYHAIHVEYQVCGSPEVHCFFGLSTHQFYLYTTWKSMLLLLMKLSIQF